MTISPTRSPRLLLATSALLAVAGSALLMLPAIGPSTTPAPVVVNAPVASPPTPANTMPSSTGATSAPATAPAPMLTAPTSSPGATSVSPAARMASPLPPPGEGTAGDPFIQRALEAAWPADLPATDAKQLVALGGAVLRADATGAGRARWPSVFSGSAHVLAPGFAAGRFRVQAAIARRDGSPDRAVVHLVWAGTDRGGTYAEGRLADWHFVRTPTKGASLWIPQSQ